MLRPACYLNLIWHQALAERSNEFEWLVDSVTAIWSYVSGQSVEWEASVNQKFV